LVAVMVMANTPNCYIPRAGDESGGNDWSILRNSIPGRSSWLCRPNTLQHLSTHPKFAETSATTVDCRHAGVAEWR
jgi:hypothetical protein